MVGRLCAAVLFMVALVGAAPADAEVSRKKAMWGPATVDGVSQFPIYAELGAGIWQTYLNWADVAPTRPAAPTDPADPAYQWPGSLDAAIGDAARFGIRVSVIAMQTPAWANGGREPRWAPTRASDYADFLTAASRRYPAIRYWMIWGEPTKVSTFQPLQDDRHRPLTGSGRRAPRKYAEMLDQSYAALKAVNPANLVIGGNTYTVGSVSPLHWIQALRTRAGRVPRMDLYGHNPFTARRPILSQPPLRFGYADFGTLDTLVGWIDRYLKGARPDGKRLKLFLSEISFPTEPNDEFNFYVSRRTQADWITDALRATRQWKRIYTLGYLSLYDDAPRSDGPQVARGLLQRDGRRKPAFQAFAAG